MRVLSSILQKAVYPALAKMGHFRRHALSPLRVITYHGVLPEGYRSEDSFLDNTLMDLSSFRSQLALLKRHYKVISPDCFLGWLQGDQKLPEYAVLLTCDDGLLNNLTTMAPVLREEGLKCLFFVTGESLGSSPAMLWYVELYLLLMKVQGTHQPADWKGCHIPGIPAEPRQRISCWLQLMRTLSRCDAAGRREFLSEAARAWGVDKGWKQAFFDDPMRRQRFQLLCSRDVRKLAEAGMTIGAHTMSHPILAEQSDELARAEIGDCCSGLQTCAGQPVWAIAYPFGDVASVGDREYKLAEASGYQCGFVNVGGGVGQTFSRFSLPRIHVTAEMSLPVYEAHISGFHADLQRRFGRSV